MVGKKVGKHMMMGLDKKNYCGGWGEIPGVWQWDRRQGHDMVVTNVSSVEHETTQLRPYWGVSDIVGEWNIICDVADVWGGLRCETGVWGTSRGELDSVRGAVDRCCG